MNQMLTADHADLPGIVSETLSLSTAGKSVVPIARREGPQVGGPFAEPASRCDVSQKDFRLPGQLRGPGGSCATLMLCGSNVC